MKYDVLKYDAANGCHLVRDETERIRRVDLIVNGDFPHDMEPESLIGKTVECDYEYPYVAIAMHVREIKPQ